MYCISMKVNILCVFLFCIYVKSDEPCHGEDCLNKSVRQHERDKYLQESNTKWRHYLKEIEKATGEYKDCVQGNCSCHARVIDEDLEIWKDGVSHEQFLNAKSHTKCLHYQVINHTLYRAERCRPNIFRCFGVEHFIQDIIHDLPDMEFLLNVHDLPQSPKKYAPRPVFSFSKVVSEAWDIRYPAHEFWAGGPVVHPHYKLGLGKWHEQRDIISKSAENWKWEKKLNIGFFRGSRTTNKRDPLIMLSRAEGDIVDAAYTQPRDTLGAEPAQTVTLEEHCKYKCRHQLQLADIYLFNIVGQAASFRFKYLFLCNSLVFHVAPDWLEFFYPAMKPWVHYIPVKEDLTDAKEMIQFARENDEVVRGIAERGRQFIWDHLRMEDITCFWLKLLKRYAQCVSYKVTRDESFIKIE